MNPVILGGWTMGTSTKYLQLITIGALAFCVAPSLGKWTAANTAERISTREAGDDPSSNAGTVSGTVRLAGPQPALKRIDMTADSACLKMHPVPILDEQVVEGANGALKNAIVFISDGLGNQSFDPPSQPVVLEQKGCTYNPRIVAVRAKEPIELVNDDPTTHNIHPMPQFNREWNMSQPPGSSPIEQTFAREEIIPVKCNVHPWMKGYIAVFKHPYFAVTNKNGSFELKNVPPGEYTIQVWQEKYGISTKKVSVSANQNRTVEFVLESKEAN